MMLHRLMPTDERDGRPGAAAGFTLVELIVTVTLVALMVGLSLPAISRTLERADARSVARTVANAFRTARNQAMSRGEPVMAKVDTNNLGEVILYRTDPTAASCLEASTSNVTEVSRTKVEEVSADRGIVGISPRSDDSKPVWLCFAADGRVLDKAGQVIKDKLCKGKNYRLFVADEGLQLSQSIKDCPSTEDKRRERRDERDLANFWVVDVPYNGAIRAYQ